MTHSIPSTPEARAHRAANPNFLPFAPDSMTRRVHREGVLLLGGGRALLMQIAHPGVAQGVAEHSNFRGDRLNRLLRTLRPTLAIVFGTREEALTAAAGINHIHHRVQGAGYSAMDPALLLWVHATLIDTSLFMHERFVRPLSPQEAAAYYDDMRHVGSLLGIPYDAMPPDVDALRRYTRDMCASLTVTDTARDIAGALFEAGPAMWPAMRSIRHLTAGLLPVPIREQFNLPWGPKREKGLRTLGGASRFVLPKLPGRVKQPPWFLLP